MKPIFIISNPRSGSTLLKMILSSHSTIAIPHEFPLIAHTQEYLENQNFEPKSFVKYLNQFSHFKDWKIDQNQLALRLEKIDSITVQNIVNAVYSMFLEPNIKNKKMWGDKNIGNIARLDDLKKLFPTAKFILLIRDPKGVVASLKKRKWLFYEYEDHRRWYIKDVYGGAHLWNEGMKLMLDFQKTNQEVCYLMKYEDMVSNQDAIIRGLCDFLEVEFEEDMLNHTSDKVKNLKIPQHRIGNTHQKILEPISVDRMKAYKNQLTNQDIQIIHQITSNYTSEFGYEYEGQAKKKSLFGNKLAHDVKNNFFYFIYRIKRLLK